MSPRMDWMAGAVYGAGFSPRSRFFSWSLRAWGERSSGGRFHARRAGERQVRRGGGMGRERRGAPGGLAARHVVLPDLLADRVDHVAELLHGEERGRGEEKLLARRLGGVIRRVANDVQEDRDRLEVAGPMPVRVRVLDAELALGARNLRVTGRGGSGVREAARGAPVRRARIAAAVGCEGCGEGGGGGRRRTYAR